jgi:hypothetical protein
MKSKEKKFFSGYDSGTTNSCITPRTYTWGSDYPKTDKWGRAHHKFITANKGHNYQQYGLVRKREGNRLLGISNPI